MAGGHGEHGGHGHGESHGGHGGGSPAKKAAAHIREAYEAGERYAKAIEEIIGSYRGKRADEKKVDEFVNKLYDAEMKHLFEYVQPEDAAKSRENLIAEYGLNRVQIRDTLNRSIVKGHMENDTVEAIKRTMKNRLRQRYAEAAVNLVSTAPENEMGNVLADTVTEIDPDSGAYVRADLEEILKSPAEVMNEARSVLPGLVNELERRETQRLYKGVRPAGGHKADHTDKYAPAH